MSEEQLEGQEGLPSTPEGADVDYKALYFDEIQNAKKQRTRAQDAEALVQTFEKRQEKSRVKSLQEQEQYKELSETLQTQLDDAVVYKEKYQTWEATEREELLSTLPEQDREAMQGESMQSLRYIAKQIVDSALEAKQPPLPSPNSRTRLKGDLSPGNVFEKMNSEDLNSNWSDVLTSYKEQQNIKK